MKIKIKIGAEALHILLEIRLIFIMKSANVL